MEFTQTTLKLPPDYEGPVEAVLFSAAGSAAPQKAVLYIHGFVDYFFQDHLAAFFTQNGYGFFALELRKYGRALLDHQHFNYCRDLSEYYPEIDQSLEAIRAEGFRDITLMGHSTGGLLAALYCAEDGQGGKNRSLVSRLLLNSPFLEINAPLLKRALLIPLVVLLGKLFPFASKKNEISPFYAESIHKSLKGEWDYDLRYKPLDGGPLYFAWLGAVRRGQRRLRRGLSVGVPVLVMHSALSSWEKQSHEIQTRSDTVLNVAHIRSLAPRIGSQVHLSSIEGGLHDLTLSSPPVRQQVLARMTEWAAAK
jgi:alpha-beta hydrolase superfamily lysophospholipase